MRHSRRYDFKGHLKSGSRSGDDLSPLSGLFFSQCLIIIVVMWTRGKAAATMA